MVIDDCRLNRECLAAQLAARGFDTDCAWDLPSLFDQLDADSDGQARTAEVILLGIDTADSHTLFQVCRDIAPAARIIVFGLAADREAEIVAWAETGAAGLHLRSESFEHLLELMAHVGDGRSQCSAEVSAILLRRVYAASAGQPDQESKIGLLTDRERQVLGLLALGLTNQQIASRLSLTLHTVKNHVHNLLAKLGVGSRSEAVAAARAARYTNPDRH